MNLKSHSDVMHNIFGPNLWIWVCASLKKGLWEISCVAWKSVWAISNLSLKLAHRQSLASIQSSWCQITNQSSSAADTLKFWILKLKLHMWIWNDLNLWVAVKSHETTIGLPTIDQNSPATEGHSLWWVMCRPKQCHRARSVLEKMF